MSPRRVAAQVHKHQDCVFTTKHNINSSAIGFGNHQKFQAVVQEAAFSYVLAKIDTCTTASEMQNHSQSYMQSGGLLKQVSSDTIKKCFRKAGTSLRIFKSFSL